MRTLATLLCALAAALIVVGCGSVGEPLYPALNIPVGVSDLSAVQRGAKLEVAFTVPALTTEGLAVKTIGGIELRIGPNSGGAFQTDRWASGAKRVDVPTPAGPGPAHAGIAVQEFVGKEVIVAVRIENAKGRFSDWSNLAVLIIEQPLTTPSNLRAESTPAGVRLSWNAPSQGGFRIFRKTAEDKEAALLATSGQLEYVDTTVAYDKPYEYYVRGIYNKAESDLAGPASITPKDTFPPNVPTGLAASAGLNGIELAWERNTEPDFKEYRVLRAEAGGPFQQIADGLEGPSYSDRKVESGKHYRYRIIAVDQAGNPSEPCNPVEVTAP